MLWYYNYMNTYYDGTKLLSLKDLYGNKPEIYICTTNRTGGKTTYFGRLLVNRFLDKQEKFGLIYRFNYELDDVANQFFKDIGELFFPKYKMYSEKKSKGIYHELYITDVKDTDNQHGKSCGYALALNNADSIKRRSHLFSDIKRMLFDEFQSETNHYCPDEINKFQSIHSSIARGQGKQVRYVPVLMISNPVSLINPYYTTLGISERLQENTKFLKGDGFVLEQGFNETASTAQKTSGFNRAFKNSDYVAYATENIYLNDNKAFIEKPTGKSRYICTLKYLGNEYGVREFSELGILYCDKSADINYPLKISVTTDDHNINYVMLKSYTMLIQNLRYFFEHGAFRFKDLQSKECIMKTISY